MTKTTSFIYIAPFFFFIILNVSKSYITVYVLD